MGCVHMVSHAFQIEKHATNVPTSCKFGFKEYLSVFMKLFLNDFNVFSDLKTHLVKI
jgi:hypothetical protein